MQHEVRLAGVQKCLVDATSRDTLMLITLRIGPEQQGKGHGTAAVQHVLELARNAGMRYVTVFPDPRSDRLDDLIRFYKKLGFRPRHGSPGDELLVYSL